MNQGDNNDPSKDDETPEEMVNRSLAEALDTQQRYMQMFESSARMFQVLSRFMSDPIIVHDLEEEEVSDEGERGSPSTQSSTSSSSPSTPSTPSAQTSPSSTYSNKNKSVSNDLPETGSLGRGLDAGSPTNVTSGTRTAGVRTNRIRPQTCKRRSDKGWTEQQSRANSRGRCSVNALNDETNPETIGKDNNKDSSPTPPPPPIPPHDKAGVKSPGPHTTDAGGGGDALSQINVLRRQNDLNNPVSNSRHDSDMESNSLPVNPQVSSNTPNRSGLSSSHTIGVSTQTSINDAMREISRAAETIRQARTMLSSLNLSPQFNNNHRVSTDPTDEEGEEERETSPLLQQQCHMEGILQVCQKDNTALQEDENENKTGMTNSQSTTRRRTILVRSASGDETDLNRDSNLSDFEKQRHILNINEDKTVLPSRPKTDNGDSPCQESNSAIAANCKIGDTPENTHLPQVRNLMVSTIGGCSYPLREHSHLTNVYSHANSTKKEICALDNSMSNPNSSDQHQSSRQSPERIERNQTGALQAYESNQTLDKRVLEDNKVKFPTPVHTTPIESISISIDTFQDALKMAIQNLEKNGIMSRKNQTDDQVSVSKLNSNNFVLPNICLPPIQPSVVLPTPTIKTVSIVTDGQTCEIQETPIEPCALNLSNDIAVTSPQDSSRKAESDIVESQDQPNVVIASTAHLTCVQPFIENLPSVPVVGGGVDQESVPDDASNHATVGPSSTDVMSSVPSDSECLVHSIYSDWNDVPDDTPHTKSPADCAVLQYTQSDGSNALPERIPDDHNSLVVQNLEELNITADMQHCDADSLAKRFEEQSYGRNNTQTEQPRASSGNQQERSSLTSPDRRSNNASTQHRQAPDDPIASHSMGNSDYLSSSQSLSPGHRTISGAKTMSSSVTESQNTHPFTINAPHSTNPDDNGVPHITLIDDTDRSTTGIHDTSVKYPIISENKLLPHRGREEINSAKAVHNETGLSQINEMSETNDTQVEQLQKKGKTGIMRRVTSTIRNWFKKKP